MRDIYSKTVYNITCADNQFDIDLAARKTRLLALEIQLPRERGRREIPNTASGKCIDTVYWGASVCSTTKRWPLPVLASVSIYIGPFTAESDEYA